jgi:predicted RNA-binding Zn ribbon-like protein
MAESSKSGEWTFDRTGDHLALDFANTVSSRHTDRPIERLPDYHALVSFARQSQLVSAAEAAHLDAWAEAEPDTAARVHDDAIVLREALHRLFSAVAASRPPDAADLDVLNERVARLRLGADLAWHWDDPAAPDALLAAVVRGAVELATGAERDRIRVCDADDCLWIFLDTSKNRTRRWCDMKQCGNRMKARRFYERQKDERRR